VLSIIVKVKQKRSHSVRRGFEFDAGEHDRSRFGGKGLSEG
jgi:hypothetical protein